VPIVQSAGTLTRLADPVAGKSSGWTTAPTWAGLSATYGQIFATQPNVRTCVEFLGRNLAQLGLHVFRRVSNLDRQRLTDHDVARWLHEPNSYTTGYRLIESLVCDLAIYFNAYWLKVYLAAEGSVPARVNLVRLPPADITVAGGIMPGAYTWETGTQSIDLLPSQLVVYDGYNPLSPLLGLSPLETLRQVLAADTASAANREAYYRNASRVDGFIERPANAPKWGKEQKTEWRTQWQERFAGPLSVGMIPVLEDGMTFRPSSFSAKDSEYTAARKLSAEEVARAYQIPLPMVGLLDHATFSNIREQHKQLYADTLGPWCKKIQAEIDRQLVPDAQDHGDIYVEFNIAEKLKGNFEEQSSALHTLIGRPIMTANEGRARLNLPQVTDDPSADALAAQQGGPAAAPSSSVSARPVADDGGIVEGHIVPHVPDLVARAVRGSWERQASRLRKLPAPQRAAAFDQPRAMRELASDLTPVLGPRALSYAQRITIETYALLVTDGDAFARTREVHPCGLMS
jgi:HK97 family phage portal protein